MLFLLPPSETKRPGGEPDSRLALASLRFPALTGARRTVLDAVAELALGVMRVRGFRLRGLS